MLFLKVVLELLHILHIEFHHNVAHCSILPVITAKRIIRIFSFPFPLPLNVSSFLLQFECGVSFLTPPA